MKKSFEPSWIDKNFEISSLLQDVPIGQLFVLTDTNSAKYCLPLFAEFIGEIPYKLLIVEAGEEYKNLVSVQVVWDFLFKHHATREAILINLGGGVITDLGGFAAATYMRGIRFVNIPTSLLAMVDASSGGKTGIDYNGVKNGIGTFTPPLATLIHPNFLRTLPTTELLSGFAEMLKHALITNKEEWIRLLQFALDDLAKEQLVEILSTTSVIQTSIQIKENIVAQDPYETGLRKILNFGHTIGHAIESATIDNNPLPHGYCVLWGMLAEVYLSVINVGCPREILQQLTQIMLQWYGRPQCDCKQRKQLIQRMYQDKKNTANKTPNFTLIKNIGEPLINQHLTEKDINEALEYLFSL
jgi:3-dehydroquinate synthase